MTPDDLYRIFIGKKLILDNNYYWLENNNKYILAKGEDSIHGKYWFTKRGEQNYLISDPPIQGLKEIEVDLFLQKKSPVKFAPEN